MSESEVKPPAAVEEPRRTTPYYATADGIVHKAPVVKRQRKGGGQSITIGFPVCRMLEYVGNESAQIVAGLMNRGDATPDLIVAAELAADALMNADPGNPKDATGWASDESRDAWVALRDALAKAAGDSAV